jgi:calmodulin
MREYKEAFEMFDRDKDGLIISKELGSILKALGHECNELEIAAMIEDVDSDLDKKINFDEFILIMNKRSTEVDIEEELMEAFKIFDKDGNGRLESNELKHIMLTLGEKLTDEEIAEMISEADSKGLGYIDYKDFVKLMLSK